MNYRALLKAELIKARHRFAIVAFTLLVVAIGLITVLPDYIMAKRHDEPVTVVFPRVWSMLVMGPVGGISALLIAIVVVLSVASEFTWRTARQNVIDGLSRDEWYSAKLMMSALFCVIFLVLVFGTGAVIALLSPFDDFIRRQDVNMFFLYALTLAGSAAAAFMLSIVTRRDGAAIGLLFLWQGFIEPMVMFALERWHKGWGATAFNFFPMRVIMENMNPRMWDPQHMANLAEVARRAPVKEYYNSPSFNAGLTLGYIFTFLVIAHTVFRRRDL